jgi:hypothetical protein
VALGTLVGAVVGIGAHILVSMRYTRSTILIPRSRFVLAGMLRPLLILTPSLLIYPFWRPLNILPAQPIVLAAWVVATVAIGWTISLNADDRQTVKSAFSRLVYWRLQRT